MPRSAGDLADGRPRRRRPPRRAACAPSTDASWRRASSARRSSAPASGPARSPTSRSSSAPSRCAERQARRTRRWALGSGSTSASSRSPTACGASVGEPLLARAERSVGHEPLGLDLLGDLAQRDLAQRGEVLDPEEVVERRVDALGRVDLAGAQALEQRLRGEVDRARPRRRARAPRRAPSRARARRVSSATLVVERLEVLDVDRREDVDAGGRARPRCPRSACACSSAGRVRVGELVDQAQLGRAAQDRRQVHLLERRCRGRSTRRRGTISQALGRAPPSPRARASRAARSRRRARPPPRPGPPGACGRSCRRRRPCRGRSCSGRGCVIEAIGARRRRDAVSVPLGERVEQRGATPRGQQALAAAMPQQRARAAASSRGERQQLGPRR